VPKHEGEEDAEGAGDAVGVGQTPGQRCEDEEEGEEVGEGGVGAVPGVACFCGGGQSYCSCAAEEGAGEPRRGMGLTLVVYHGSEDFLRREEETRHLPYRHLKVHLRELEESLEEPGHAQRAVALLPRGDAAECAARVRVVPGKGYRGIHDGAGVRKCAAW